MPDEISKMNPGTNPKKSSAAVASDRAKKSDALPDISDEELDALATKRLVMFRLNQLHETIKKYLASDGLEAKRVRVYGKHKLTKEEQIIVTGLELAVFLGDVSIEEFTDELWQRIPWEDTAENEDRAVALAIDIMGQVFLSAQAFLGDVVAEIRLQGGDASKYSVEPLEERVITYDQALDDIMQALDTDELDEAGANRLRHIIESYLRNVRDEVEARRMLTKTSKTGGLEMSEVDADEIISYVESQRHLTRYVEVMPREEGEAEEAASSEPTFTAEEIRSILAGSAEEQKAVSKQLQELESNTDGNPEMLREVLFGYVMQQSTLPPEKEEVIAALLLFVRRGDLVSALMEDERYQESIVRFFRDSKDDLDDKIKEEPAGPAAMNAFLQIVLRGIAQLSPADAARYGLRVINALKKKGESQYVELIAFDMDRGEFVWTQPINF